MAPYQRLGDLAWVLSADAEPPANLASLYRETMVPQSVPDTFAFFADASNLGRLTPEWLNFRMLTPAPVTMRAGLELDYRISIYGVPVPWRSRIDVWEPEVRFVDRQVVGPYRWWHHEHRFIALPTGTLVVDHVKYVPRAGWISAAFVRRDLERIFEYRHKALSRIFGGARRGREGPR
jgi:hypothetical protein